MATSTSKSKGTSAATLNRGRKPQGTTPNGGSTSKGRKRSTPATTAPPVSGNQREKMEARIAELTSQDRGMSGKESDEVQRLKSALEGKAAPKGKGTGASKGKGTGSGSGSSNGRVEFTPADEKVSQQANKMRGKPRTRPAQAAKLRAMVKGNVEQHFGAPVATLRKAGKMEKPTLSDETRQALRKGHVELGCTPASVAALAVALHAEK